MTTQVWVVDDSPQWRAVVHSLLEHIPSLQIVGEASNGLEAIQKAATLLPDIALPRFYDFQPRPSGAEARVVCGSDGTASRALSRSKL